MSDRPAIHAVHQHPAGRAPALFHRKRDTTPKGGATTLEELPRFVNAKEKMIFAVVPTVHRVLATERTVEGAVAQQFSPLEYSSRIEPVDTNAFQIFAARTELLEKLRALGRDVAVVPYPAAVRAALGASGLDTDMSFRDRTRVFIQGLQNAAGAKPAERVVVDVVGEDYLITALRGKEVVTVRHVREGAAIEIQRTIASARLNEPGIFSTDEQLVLELRSAGYEAGHLSGGGTFLGEAGLEKARALRYLTDEEVARERALANRRQAIAVLLVASLVFLAGAGVWAWARSEVGLSRERAQQAAELLTQRQSELSTLYLERYGSLARQHSVSVHEEFFDLLTALPPQVALVSIERSDRGLEATVARRPGAAPFSRSDLTSALATSAFFAGAEIKEEYQGHTVRYVLAVAPPRRAAP
jgi:hypothetical protein